MHQVHIFHVLGALIHENAVKVASEFVGDDRSLVDHAKLSDLLSLGFHLGHGLAALVKADHLVKDFGQHLDGQLSIHESHIEGSLETLVLDRKHKVMDEFVQLTIVLIIKFMVAFDLILIGLPLNWNVNIFIYFLIFV